MVIAGPGDGCRVGAGFEMPRSVVSELLDRRGVDAGFEAPRSVVSGLLDRCKARRVCDGPLTEPAKRRSSSWAKSNDQAKDKVFLRATYCRLHLAIQSIYSSARPKADLDILEMFYPSRLFLRNRHYEWQWQ